jgi:hypothetical protein
MANKYRMICPDFPLFTLAGLGHTQRVTFIHSFPATHSISSRPEALSNHLRRPPQLRSLAANPISRPIVIGGREKGIPNRKLLDHQL